MSFLSKSFIIAILLLTVPFIVCNAQKVSSIYTCVSNNKPVTVYEFGPKGIETICLANIYEKGDQRITISASEDIQSFSILPESAEIKGKATGKNLSFSVRGQKKLHIQVNNLPCLELTVDKPEKKTERKTVEADYHYTPGEYFVGTIDLKDGQSIRIEEGALVHADITGGGNNITISGRGILNGALRLQNCDNLRVKDITMCNSVYSWSNTLICCTNSSYSNVKVYSCGAIYSQDGINPVACKNFTIENCFIRTVDDCIAIKSFEADKNGDMGSRNITVKHCVMVGWRCADGITMGFELNGGEVKDILVQDCDILRADGYGATGGHSAFSIVCDGAADVHHITYDNIRISSDISPKNMELIVTDGTLYGIDKPGQIHDIMIKNVKWSNPANPFIIKGYGDHIIRNVLFKKCSVAGKPLKSKKSVLFEIENAEGITFR